MSSSVASRPCNKHSRASISAMYIVFKYIILVTVVSLIMTLRLGFGLRSTISIGAKAAPMKRTLARRLASSGSSASTDSPVTGQNDNHFGEVGGQMCVVSTAIAFLEGKKKIVSNLSPADYSVFDEIIGASVGGHVRHTLDHFAKCIAALSTSIPTDRGSATASSNAGDQGTDKREKSRRMIRYDHRERGGTIETDPKAALELIVSLQSTLEQLPRSSKEPEALRAISVTPAFVVDAGEGKGEHVFESNLERELFFCCHHGVHHDAMIRLILQRMDSDGARSALGDKDLGVAAGTAVFRQEQETKESDRR